MNESLTQNSETTSTDNPVFRETIVLEFRERSSTTAPQHDPPNAQQDVEQDTGVANEAKRHNPLAFMSNNPQWYFTYAPLLTYFTAFVFAWIYTMIPSNNYYIFFVVKGQVWNVLATSCFTELFSVTIPDINDEIYILVYLIGWIMCPLFFGLSKGASFQNTRFDAVITTIPYLACVVGFGYNVCMYPKSADQLRRQNRLLPEESKDPDQNQNNRSASGNSGYRHNLFQSMFAATRGSMAIRGTSVSIAPNFPINPMMTVYTGSDIERAVNPSRDDNKTNPEKPHDKLFPQWVHQCFHRDYFFFLPKFWPWYQFHHISKLPPNIDRRFLWILISLLVYFFTQDYVFLVLFTYRFREMDQTIESTFKLFVLYITVTTCFRIVIKFLGLQLDKYRNKTVSLYFIGEVMGLLYYYTFYRVLFESVRSIGEFIVLLSVHLVSEWILYVARSSLIYYQLTDAFSQRCLKCLGNQRLTYEAWQEFIALDFGIRCSIFVSTGYGILLLLVTIQFVPWVGATNGLKSNLVGFRYTAVFLLLSCVFELINATLMVKYYFLPRGLNVLRMTRHCYSLRYFCLVSMLIASTLFINPVYALTTIPSG
jgi:hypothetical protein